MIFVLLQGPLQILHALPGAKRPGDIIMEPGQKSNTGLRPLRGNFSDHTGRHPPARGAPFFHVGGGGWCGRGGGGSPPRRGVGSYDIDLFVRQEDARWQRLQERHRQYAYTMQELQSWLEEAGFGPIRQYGDRRMTPPRMGEQRVFFAAHRKGEG